MTDLGGRLNAIRDALGYVTPAGHANDQEKVHQAAGQLLEAVEAVLEKCDDYLKWERDNPKESFEFGMAEAARDVQAILTEKLGGGEDERHLHSHDR